MSRSHVSFAFLALAMTAFLAACNSGTDANSGASTTTSVVATPTFSPASGTYSAAQTVTISCSTAGATIHYTTNGTAPTSSTATYSGPIAVSASKTLKAIAVKSGMTNSGVASATYTISG